MQGQVFSVANRAEAEQYKHVTRILFQLQSEFSNVFVETLFCEISKYIIDH